MRLLWSLLKNPNDNVQVNDGIPAWNNDIIDQMHLLLERETLNSVDRVDCVLI